jgi:hypothetical protein
VGYYLAPLRGYGEQLLPLDPPLAKRGKNGNGTNAPPPLAPFYAFCALTSCKAIGMEGVLRHTEQK